jgi:hypothetical protein
MKALHILSVLLLVTAPHRTCAWGDDGHKAIALIAEQYLEPAVKTKVAAMLDADPDGLTPHNLASEATWADNIETATTGETTTNRRKTGTSSIWKSTIPI